MNNGPIEKQHIFSSWKLELFGDLGGQGKMCTNRIRQMCPGKVEYHTSNHTILITRQCFCPVANNCRGFVANTAMPRDGGSQTATREVMGTTQILAGTGDT